MAHFEVVRPGALTTVQDLGRWGWQSSGVQVAGPMDAYSHRLANRLAGNEAAAAALEVTLTGPLLRAHGAVTCAIAGATFVVEVDGREIEASAEFEVPDGATLRLGVRRAGARTTVAVQGGFDVPAAFGSRATCVVGRMGPFGGRAVKPGDELPVAGRPRPRLALPAGRPLVLPQGGARVRVMMGPDEWRFNGEAMRRLLEARFVVSPQSNRMGYRLDGETLPAPGRADMLSAPTPMGTIQVTPSGQPILLMADRPTTGGYPRIATVITADLPFAGQLAPGEWIEFAVCTRAEAREALRMQEAALTGGAR